MSNYSRNTPFIIGVAGGTSSGKVICYNKKKIDAKVLFK